MNRDTASYILTNLRERAENSVTPVVLTTMETRALQVLFGASEIQPLSDTGVKDVNVPNDKVSRGTFEGTLNWKHEYSIPTDIVLCLDFGTSFSKAFACRTDKSKGIPDLIDIEFSKSDDESTRYFLPSELLIYDDRVYYGMAARSQFRSHRSYPRPVNR